jgi:peptidoglycan hydrolase-like protein with peptidoglycan-binding domain
MNYMRSLWRSVLLGLFSLSLFFVSGGSAYAAPHASLCANASCSGSPALVNAPFSLFGSFNEPVADFTTASINTTNANISNVVAITSGTITNFTFLVTPIVDGAVSVTIDNGAAQGLDGSPIVGTQPPITTTYDSTPPVIAGMPSDSTAEATGPDGAAVSFNMPTASDLNGVQSISCDHASGDTFVLGTTTVVCSATDNAGNVATSKFAVSIVDTTPPVITAPIDQTFVATGVNTTPVLIPATATDAVSTPTITYSPTSFPVGTTEVTWTATDAAGNDSTATSNVTIVDTTPPTLDEHTDVSAQATTTDGTVVTYELPSATDIVDGAIGVACSPASGSIFALGDTLVSCTANPDAHGNATSSISFTVHVAAPGDSAGSVVMPTTTASDGSSTGTFSDGLSASALVDAGGVSVDIPAGTNVSGDAAWDGSFALPATASDFAQPVADAGNTINAVVSAIEIGASTTPLMLDQAVRISFVGQAGESVGWSRAGVFRPIATVCSADSQTAADAQLTGGVTDCKIDSNGDLVVWTKHFTTFVTYTQTAIAQSSSGGGGSSGGGSNPAPNSSSSGGGGGGGGSVLVPAASSPIVGIVEPAATSSGEVLGASAYNFTLYLKFGSHGTEVTELQKILVADGLLKNQPTGYYGTMTAAAVTALQKLHGIAPTGTVGPITRTLLNQGGSGQVLGASAYNFTNDLTLGSTGTDVTELQKILVSAKLLKSTLPLGYYGMYTALAVSAYQKAHGVAVSGMVDSATRVVLNEGNE